MQDKIEIIFKSYFSFSLTMFMKFVIKFNYFLLINDKALIICCEIMKIIYKTNSNKIFKINKFINKTLQQLARVIIE